MPTLDRSLPPSPVWAASWPFLPTARRWPPLPTRLSRCGPKARYGNLRVAKIRCITPLDARNASDLPDVPTVCLCYLPNVMEYPAMLTRRGFVRLGSLGLAGLALPRLLESRARAAPTQRARDRSCILIFLEGGASHIDTFDMKPLAPVEFRGEFAPIQTSVPGIHLCEYLPLTAKLAHHWAVVRSITQRAR